MKQIVWFIERESLSVLFGIKSVLGKKNQRNNNILMLKIKFIYKLYRLIVYMVHILKRKELYKIEKELIFPH